MILGGLELLSNFLLAPLAGYTDVGFRKVCSKCGAGLTFTEMVSAKGLVYGNEKTDDLLHTTSDERYKCVQLFGSEPEFIYKAVKSDSIKTFDLIDINMGCPVPKIVKNGEGSALINDIGRAKEVVLAAKEKGVPVSVKTRLGFELNDFKAIEFAQAMQDVGVAFVTVHGRTKAQLYTGKSDYSKIAEVVKNVDMPIIANGDVTDIESAEQILNVTKASGVMIGRGALGNPFLFSYLAKQYGYDNAVKCEYNKSLSLVASEHFQTLLEYHNERFALLNFKKQIPFYAKHTRNSKTLKLRAFTAESVEEMKDIINEIGERE